MLWRNMDPTHPKHAESDVRFGGWIPYLYERMDELVGEVLPAVDDKTLLLICSDHGFAQFGRQFHLNTWLRDNGYLTLKPEAAKKPETAITDVDWKQTLAYGIGFNGLYLNLEGREGQGIVEADKGARDHCAAAAGSSKRSPIRRPVSVPWPRSTSGTRCTWAMPRRRCRSCWSATRPGTEARHPRSWAPPVARPSTSTPGPGAAITPWPATWYPGSLFSSHQVAKAHPSILDLPVTILEFFGHRPTRADGGPLHLQGLIHFARPDPQRPTDYWM